LAGLWIGAAISNTSHSKPVLPLSNKHDSRVKDQGRRQCCHNKHKKFPYRPIRDVSLLSGHASYMTRSFECCILWQTLGLLNPAAGHVQMEKRKIQAHMRQRLRPQYPQGWVRVKVVSARDMTDREVEV
jgi:hypothetical protein